MGGGRVVARVDNAGSEVVVVVVVSDVGHHHRINDGGGGVAMVASSLEVVGWRVITLSLLVVVAIAH